MVSAGTNVALLADAVRIVCGTTAC